MMRRLAHRPAAWHAPLLVAAALASTVTLPGCGRSTPAVDPGYLAQINAWRAERLASLTADDGWLTVVGLFWLHPGENRFGTDPGNEVVLPGKGTAAVAGTLELRPDGTVLLHPGSETGVTVAGLPATERTLVSDRGGKPDVLAADAVRFYLIERGGRVAVRVKDPHSARRVGFAGLRYFPVDPAYRVEGAFEPYPVPREVVVATVQGPEQKMLAPGLIRFRLGGRSLSLEPFISSPSDTEFFFVFRDATSGTETYGAGRFLDAPAPKAPSRVVVLDFNQAYSPPCAFTPHATCPLPPKQNELSVRIEAGEMFGPGH